jgi:hypothetical protein
MMSVVVLSFVMPNVILLSVVAPQEKVRHCTTTIDVCTFLCKKVEERLLFPGMGIDSLKSK